MDPLAPFRRPAPQRAHRLGNRTAGGFHAVVRIASFAGLFLVAGVFAFSSLQTPPVDPQVKAEPIRVTEPREPDFRAIPFKRSRTFLVQETLAFTTLYKETPEHRIGWTQVVRKGSDGVVQTTYEEVFENGCRSIITVKREVVREAVPRIMEVGVSKSAALTTRSVWSRVVWERYQAIAAMLVPNGSFNYMSFEDNGDGTITVDGQTFQVHSKSERTITAYDGVEWCTIGHRDADKYPDCIVPREHTTFSGIPARRGVVATYGFKENGKWVATRLPMGTVVFVEEYGLAVVGDIHHVVFDIDRIDCSYDPREVLDQYHLGRTRRRVYILDFP